MTRHNDTTFFRLLKTPIDDKGDALAQHIAALNAGGVGDETFIVDPTDFCVIRASPFAYWLNADLRRDLGTHSTLEPTAATVRQGLATGDDFRFVRAIWEVNPADIYFCYYPSDGQPFCLRTTRPVPDGQRQRL